MEDTITCPNCGEQNLPDLPFCSNCQWRLHPRGNDWEADDRQGPASAAPGSSDEAGPTAPIPDWLSRLDASPRDLHPPSRLQTPTPDDADIKSPVNDLLAGLTSGKDEQEVVPEWVARIMGLNPADDSLQEPPPQAPRALESRTDAHDSDQNAAFEQLLSADLADAAVPPDSAPAAHRGNDDRPPGSDAAEHDQVYEWLKKLDESAASHAAPSQPRAPTSPPNVPSWIDAMTGVADATSRTPVGSEDTLPEWLLESQPGFQSAPRATGAPQEPVSQPPEAQPIHPAPLPEESVESPATAPVKLPPQTASVPPFTPDEVKRLDVDALFASMQMPEWLADAERGKPDPAGQSPAAALPDEEIRPAALPSWVQAMQPHESVQGKPEAPPTPAKSEDRGPLLGLHGVLPAIPGAGLPSTRPRSQSLKLEASDQHRSHAALLENVLAAESRPRPLRGSRQLRPERVLRWGIAAVILLLIGTPKFLGTSRFPLPLTLPLEANAAIKAVQSLEPGAPVLAVFDYEPALAGEMEASAASLMDHLLLLKHPRLAVISTLPVGPALADRFIHEVLTDRAYVRGQQYVNLGFLPGGLAGVQLFAHDPVSTVPLGAGAERVWDAGPLQGLTHLSGFGAIILLTDSAEAGRVWIEQTHADRGSSALIVVSSAQTGPMLMPYFDSGQISGLVSGLNGAAGTELANGGRPGIVRRYWDAYSLGLQAAAALMIFGAAWQHFSGVRERRQESA